MEKENGLKVSILASGSKGNATYIETPRQKLLIDAGLSGKKLEELMQSINRSLTEVDSLLVTHEHSDHIQGVGVLARRYNLNVYANEKTWQAMDAKVGKIATEKKHIFAPDSYLALGDLDIESFRVSHDAADPQFYGFHHDGSSFVALTDTGYVSERMIGMIENANAYLLECNHDTNMLRYGRYPWSLKQRILGDEGHLSNDDGAQVLSEIIGDTTKKVFLGHRSQENNTRDLAHLTVSDELLAQDFAVGEDFALYDTYQSQATPLQSVKN